MARPGTVFIAVGAGHLAGPDSVQAALAAHGLRATRVPQSRRRNPPRPGRITCVSPPLFPYRPRLPRSWSSLEA